MAFTLHVDERGAERNVSDDEVLYIIEHGRWEQRAGIRLYFLGRRDVPEQDRSDQWAQRLVGLCVLTKRVSDNEILVITVYRNSENGLKDHRRKPKYDCHKWASLAPGKVS